jgi:preprotein translocase subunit SecE
MANPSVDNVSSTSDKLMLAVAVLLVVAGIAGFYALGQQDWYVRGAALFAGLIAAVVVAYFSAAGKAFVAFAKDSYREVTKVVWPTRKEAGQTTLVVFGFVLVMALCIWGSDKTIEWVVFSLILGWK